MELVLEQDEIDSLLREALKARGMNVPDNSVIRIRRNNKTATIRVVFLPHNRATAQPSPGRRKLGR